MYTKTCTYVHVRYFRQKIQNSHDAIHVHRSHKQMMKNSKSPKRCGVTTKTCYNDHISDYLSGLAGPIQTMTAYCVYMCHGYKNSYQRMQTSHRHRGSNWDRNVLAHTIRYCWTYHSKGYIVRTYVHTVWDVWDASIQSPKRHHSKTWMNIWRFLSPSCLVQHSSAAAEDTFSQY